MWAQVFATILGVWLTAAPGVLGYEGPARVNDHVFGPLAATFGLIAVFEVTRAARWLNLAVAAWLLVAPWALGYGTVEVVNSAVVGLALASASLIRGRLTETFGGGWSVLWDRRYLRTPSLQDEGVHPT